MLRWFINSPRQSSIFLDPVVSLLVQLVNVSFYVGDLPYRLLPGLRAISSWCHKRKLKSVLFTNRSQQSGVGIGNFFGVPHMDDRSLQMGDFLHIDHDLHPCNSFGSATDSPCGSTRRGSLDSLGDHLNRDKPGHGVLNDPRWPGRKNDRVR